ncbi:hypothetical protein T265_11392 [Opisthorchis viverrini]|uniref:Uncharacterized protein n=1 Tax=Opisthorchis viverrini TaxID=6198 RepID=A0A074Z9N8_OPIVI|nr:hypothetical protein T265_11392 [Opisthorchis viverrini]KER19960.1 hypothetical protein T265_11392 [Opisthorchis viverrini]
MHAKHKQTGNDHYNNICLQKINSNQSDVGKSLLEFLTVAFNEDSSRWASVKFVERWLLEELEKLS